MSIAEHTMQRGPHATSAPAAGNGDAIVFIEDAEMVRRLAILRGLVAQPVPTSDPQPSDTGHGLFIGNRHHAANAELLTQLGITAVLNCAPSGIRNLPLDAYRERNIQYAFTNVAQDSHTYPILHGSNGVCSDHFEVARSFYESHVVEAGGKVLFFCIAGQNRSAALAVGVQVARGIPLHEVLAVCARTRPFILENIGFQRQLVELDTRQERMRGVPSHRLDQPLSKRARTDGSETWAPDELALELVVPGLRTFQVELPAESPVDVAKERAVKRVDAYFASLERPCRVGAAWLVFNMFPATPVPNDVAPEPDLILEEAAVEPEVQLARLQDTFGLEVRGDHVFWTRRCRFEFVLFSIFRPSDGGVGEGEGVCEVQEPFTFRHQERANAPGTLLSVSMIELHLRAWDFVSGESFRSLEPIVFSYSEDARSKRDFMNISTSREGRQQFDAPGEGGILGMGNNAIVHHVQLERIDAAGAPASAPTSDSSPPWLRPQEPGSGRGSWTLPPALRRQSSDSSLFGTQPESRWDAAVKRPFSMAKMLASMERKAEAGIAKRLRMAGALNRQGRLLYFYGLGICLAANNADHESFKFEATLLSQYLEDFSTYTLKRFIDDYTTPPAVSARLSPEEHRRLCTLQGQFTLVKVKVLLVSLLNGFRDLMLMGVQAFDFNHLNNVLISRDYRKARLIDIDGACKGFYDPSEPPPCAASLHRPTLDVDLSTLLPLLVQQLLIGKGRGKSFVTEQIGKARRQNSDADAKAVLSAVIRANFFSARGSTADPVANDPASAARESTCSASAAAEAQRRAEEGHLHHVVDWFHAMLFKRAPWTTWTADIYDAMRCIDHLPVG